MPETTTVRVMIVDPEPFFHEKLCSWLRPSGHVVVGVALTTEEAAGKLDQFCPSLVVLGPHLEEHKSFALSREIKYRTPNVRTVIFTACSEDVLFQADAANAGIAACLSRSMTNEECLEVIASAMAGYQLFSHEILALAFQSIQLTPREREVLRLVAKGKTDHEIAGTLTLKPATIRNHTQHILEKLDVHDRHAAVRRARRLGLV